MRFGSNIKEVKRMIVEMRKRKRGIYRYISCAFSVLFLLFLFPTMPVFADAEETETKEILEEQLETSGANDLFHAIPEEAGQILEENGIDGVDPEKMMNFSIGDFFGNLWQMVDLSPKRNINA